VATPGMTTEQCGLAGIPGISLRTPVVTARAYLQRRHETAAVVLDGECPVGVITLYALRGHRGAIPRSEACVADVMDFECVRIAPDADTLATLRAYRDESWNSLRRRRPMASDTRHHRAQAFR
jgi:hypothetical protein